MQWRSPGARCNSVQCGNHLASKLRALVLQGLVSRKRNQLGEETRGCQNSIETTACGSHSKSNLQQLDPEIADCVCCWGPILADLQAAKASSSRASPLHRQTNSFKFEMRFARQNCCLQICVNVVLSISLWFYEHRVDGIASIDNWSQLLPSPAMRGMCFCTFSTMLELPNQQHRCQLGTWYL